MSSHPSRRTLLAASSAALLPATAARAMTTDPTFWGAVRLATDAPHLAEVAPWQGDRFTALQGEPGGRIFYGYGNYATNSGSRSHTGVSVAYFDTATGLFGTALGMPGEAIETYRVHAGRTYVPNTDPITGGVALATDVTGTLGTRVKAMTHVHDIVCGVDANDIVIAGSTDVDGVSNAIVHRSRDGGNTWSEVYRYAEGVGGDYERVNWLTRIADTVFWRADVGTIGTTRAPMMVLDLVSGRLTKVSDSKFRTGWSSASGRSLYVGEDITRGRQVVSTGTLAYFVHSPDLWWFDGRSVGRVQSNATYPYSVNDVAVDPVTSTVYANDQSGIYRVAGKSMTLVKSLQTGYDIAEYDAFTVLSGVGYLAANSGYAIYRLPLS